MNITFYDRNEQPWTFLHVPKTAGKSISAYIMRNNPNASKTLHPTSHATLAEMQSLNVDLGTTFAVFRNPYARAVSLYKYLYEDDIKKVLESSIPYFHQTPNTDWHDIVMKEYGRNLSFLSFCKILPWIPLGIEQYHYLPVDKKLKMETLDKDFKFIQDLLGTNESLYKFNCTNNRPWQSYYTSDTKKIIYQTYKKDFKLLGYSKDINNSST